MLEKRRLAILNKVAFEQSREDEGGLQMSWGTASAETVATQLLASTDASFLNILSDFKTNPLQLHFTAYIRHPPLVFFCTVIFEIK